MVWSVVNCREGFDEIVDIYKRWRDGEEESWKEGCGVWAGSES